jgi:hypothetical protein
MCPFCAATVAWIVAGTLSTGGISALVVTRLRTKTEDPATKTNNEEGENHA